MNYFVDFYILLLYGAEGLISNNLIGVFVPLLAEDLHFRTWKQFWLFLLKVAASVICMNLLCAASYFCFGQIAMSQICGGVLVVVYLLVFSRISWFTKAVYVCSFFAVIEVVFVTCFALFDIMAAGGTREHSFLAILLLAVLMAACVIFFRVFSPEKLKEPLYISGGILFLVCAASTAFWVMTNVWQLDGAFRLAVAIILLAFLLTAYYSVYAISKAVEANNARRIGDFLRAADENMLLSIEQNMDHLRCVRHEMVNQYMYMKELLQEGEYDKLNSYFEEYTGTLTKAFSIVDCGNRVVSAVMNAELQKAAQAGISIEYTLQVPPETGFADGDFCSLLFNVLNNAIEYLRLRPQAERIISFLLRMEGKKLLLSCQNSIITEDIQDAKRLRTRKENAELHGYGSKVIRTVAETYNGRVEYRIIDGKIFSVSAVLFEPERSARPGGSNEKDQSSDL